MKPNPHLPTHEVTNQPDPQGDRDLWADDPALCSAVRCQGGQPEPLAAFGRTLGEVRWREAGRAANCHPPELHRFDRSGRLIDEVEFHPAYHSLMELGLSSGYAAIAWEKAPGGHVTHTAMVYLLSQVEPGCCCPMTMTYAAVPALVADPGISATWQPKLLARDYDPAITPISQKRAATLGMAMTEKQGGSDVRTNTTAATRDGEGYRLRGHKWFCSAPMGDGFLTLAQTKAGLTCFLVPRWLEDGTRNGIHLMRLKDKLGNRANASAEIEYHDAYALRLGDEGDGIRTILEMVHHTRLDTALAPAGLMRAALTEAHWWCSHRNAFQRRLIDQPLMARVLADLTLDWEASLALGLRVARAFDKGDTAFSRLAAALAKFLSNKVCPRVIVEAMECLGGAGYVEESPMPMLYREAPLNAIWEGSGNVICLDILRTIARMPEALEAVLAETGDALPEATAAFTERWKGNIEEADARRFAEDLATLLSAAVLCETAPALTAEAYLRTRIGGSGRLAGTQSGTDDTAILNRLTA